MDELPVWGFVGLPPEEAKDDEHIYIYTHKSLEINYNGDRVGYFTLKLLVSSSVSVCHLHTLQSSADCIFVNRASACRRSALTCDS